MIGGEIRKLGGVITYTIVLQYKYVGRVVHDEFGDEENRAEFIRSNISVNLISHRAVYVYLDFVHIYKKNKILKICRALSTLKWRKIGEHGEHLALGHGENWRARRALKNRGENGEHSENRDRGEILRP